MFSHITVGSNDLAVSRRFYDALFAAIGGRPGMTDEDGKLVYIKDGRMFIVTPPIDGQPACHANGGTIGFALETPQAVHAGRTQASPTAAAPSKIHRAYATRPGGSCTWPTCAIPTATSCAPCT